VSLDTRTKLEVDALGVLTISRGCYERCCSNTNTPPNHSNLSFATLRTLRPTLLRASAYRTPSEASSRRRCGHASRFLSVHRKLMAASSQVRMAKYYKQIESLLNAIIDMRYFRYICRYLLEKPSISNINISWCASQHIGPSLLAGARRVDGRALGGARRAVLRQPAHWPDGVGGAHARARGTGAGATGADGGAGEPLYTYIHTYMHTYIHTYVHTYVHTCIHTCIHTCTAIYLYTYMHAYIHTYIHKHTAMYYIHTCIYTYMHTYMHACIHAYIHPYTHTYIHTCIDGVGGAHARARGTGARALGTGGGGAG